MDIRTGIIQTATALGIDPVDLATAISYETAGTFDPAKRGPTTQWGQHRGLIQFGEPQARQYGVDWSNPVGSQLGPDGAVAKYLRSTGVKPGMGLLDIYSAINAGGVGLYNRTDANNGGAPGTVRDKVEQQMGGHRQKAVSLLGGDYTPAPTSSPEQRRSPSISTQGKAPMVSLLDVPEFQEDRALGGLLSRDKLDRLVMGLEGMTLNPNVALMQAAGRAIEGRAKGREETKARAEQAKQANRTIEWLQSQGRSDLAQAVAMGGMGASDAVKVAMTPAEARKGIEINGKLVDPVTGRVIGDYGGEDDRTALMKNAEYLMRADPSLTLDKAVEMARGGTTVNVGAGESAFQKETGKGLATEAADIANQGMAAQRSLGQIATLETALRNAPQGASGALTNFANNLGIKTEGSSSAEVAQAIINQLVPQQRQPGSGPMSDADLALFKQSLPRLVNTPEGNQKILSTMRAIAEYDVKRGQIARQMQLGKLTPEQGFAAYEALGNPLADFAAEAPASPGSSAPAKPPAATGGAWSGPSSAEIRRMDRVTAERLFDGIDLKKVPDDVLKALAEVLK